MQIADFKKFKLPDNPGVYFFKKGKNILYIGKATFLKDRVRSYFSNDVISTRGSLIVDMVTQADTIDFIKTDSVLEALILEAELIKKHQPLANTKEKDNKSYSFVVITKDELPRVIIERGRVLEFGSRIKSGMTGSVFGPFPSLGQLQEALKIIRKIFPFLTDKKSSKLYQQIGLEPTVSERKEYMRTIRNVKLFFQGKKGDLIRKLTQEMKSFAKEKEFELAAKRRNQIFALNHLRDVSLLKTDAQRRPELDSGSFRIESYDIAHMRGSHSVGVMTVVEDGEIKKADYRKFILRDTKKGDDVGGLREIISRRLKHDEWPMPNLVVVDGGKTQKNMAEKLLKELGLEAQLVSVVKDEKHRPREILGINKALYKHEKEILIANSESHRFAIDFYRTKHRKSL